MMSNYSSFSEFNVLRTKTLEDLYLAIRIDPSLNDLEKQRLLAQLKAAVGFAPSNTRLSSLVSRGLGGIVGFLIAKYFNMSPVGQALSTIAGIGLGSTLYNHLNQQNPYPGWKMI